VELITSSAPSLEDFNQYSGNCEEAWTEDDAAVQQGCVFRPRCKYATDVWPKVEPTLTQLSPQRLAACHNPLVKNLTQHLMYLI